MGVDPATLEMTDDYGVKVPLLLVTLKQAIVKGNGLSKEGIFRHSGDESTISSIAKSLNESLTVDSEDVHSMAAYIKRWFCKLPKCLFHSITSADLEMATKDPVKAYSYVCSKLVNPQLSLFQWIIAFMVDIARNSSKNKMVPKNIAIMLAAVVMVINESEGMQFLQKIQKVTSLLQIILEQKM